MVAVTLTFPVQFYPAIEVIETRLGMRGDAHGAAHRQQQDGQRQGGVYALVGSSDVESDVGDPDARQAEEEEDPGSKGQSRRKGKGAASGQEYQQLLQEEEEDVGDSDGVEEKDEENEDGHEGSIYEEGAEEDGLLLSTASENGGLDSTCARLKRLCLRCACVLFAGSVALAVPNLEIVIVRSHRVCLRTRCRTISIVYCAERTMCTLTYFFFWVMLLIDSGSAGFVRLAKRPPSRYNTHVCCLKEKTDLDSPAVRCDR